MEFENTFGDFSEVSVDVTSRIKSLKWVCGIIVVVIFVFGAVIYSDHRKSEIFQSYPFVFPLAAVMLGIAVLHYASKYFSYLNSFPEKNPIVFSGSGIKIPLFFFNPFKFMSEGSRSPRLIAWNDIENISYVTIGKGSVPHLRIKYIYEGKKAVLNIEKKLLDNNLNEIEAYLNQHHSGKFEKTSSASVKSSKQIRLIVIMVMAGIFVAQISPIIAKFFNNKTEDVESVTKSSYSDQEIARAMKWGTPSDPAILTNLPAEDYKIENWPNGQVKFKEPLVNGRLNGMGQYWWDNGNLYGEIPWLNGQKHGSFTLYTQDGQPDQKLTYKMDKPHGISEWFTLNQKWLYIEGEPIKELHD